MMQQVHLFVTDTSGNSVTLDLYNDEKMHMNFAFNDIMDLQPSSNYSREFRVPASERNIEFFGSIYNVNFDGWFDFRVKVPSSLNVETIPIAVGHIQVKKVYWTQGKLFEFELTFFGEVASLGRALTNKKLRDLTQLPELNFDFDYANVLVDPNPYTILTLCDKYNFTAYNAAEGFQPLYSALNSNSSQYKPLQPNQMTPAVDAKWIFDQIMLDAGFSYEFEKMPELLKDVYVPWLNSKDPNTNLGITEISTGMGLDAPYSFAPNQISIAPQTATFWDYNGQVSAGVFTAQWSGVYAWNIKMSGTTDNCCFGVYLGLYNTTTNQYFDVMDGVQGWYGNALYLADVDCGATNTFNLNLISTIQMNEGDQLEIRIGEWQGDFAGNINLNGNATTIETGIELINVGTTGFCNMVNNSPDMLQVDFIKSIQKMFNLAIVPNRNNVNSLYIDPMVSYIASTDGGDWTQKIDLSKDIMIYPTTDIQKATFKFTYAADGDYYNKFYQNSGRTFGEYKIDQYDFDVQNDFASGEEKIELAFASTPSNGITYTDVVCPRFLNEQGEFTKPKPRILYWFANFMVNMHNGTSVVPTNVKCLNNYSTMNADVSDKDLNFAPEVPLHTIVANPYNNLYNVYWRNYYREIYDGQARIMEAYFTLTLSDILTFKFSDKIWLMDSYWRILEINEYVVGGMEATKVKLIRILDINNLCALTPVSVGTNYLINWEDEYGNPATIDEECCLRFGYYWNGSGERGACFAKPQGVTDGHEVIANVGLQKSTFGMPIKTNGVMYPVKEVTTDTYLGLTDSIVFGDAGGGTIKIWLPPINMAIGQEITIRNIDPSGTLSIRVQGGGNIEGGPILNLVGTSAANFVSNGTRYYFTGKS